LGKSKKIKSKYKSKRGKIKGKMQIPNSISGSHLLWREAGGEVFLIPILKDFL
jgi:hypothetical protein